MNLLGVHLTLLIGPTVAVPAPSFVMEALDSVQVTHSDQGRSGFQLQFKAGRSGLGDVVDDQLLLVPLLAPFNRVIIIVTFNTTPQVLMDGIITHQQFSPGSDPGTSTFAVTGEDVSVMMDLEEKSVEHPAQPEMVIALKLIATYAQYGLIPMVLPPPSLDVPILIERTPTQQGTDLTYLKQMAQRFGYVFYVKPGPAPFTNTAYWGPPERIGLPQPALSVNMASQTNVMSINFQYDAMAPTLVSGEIQDRQTNQKMPVQTFASTRPPLAAMPALLVNQPNVKKVQFRETGLNATQAFARAQGITDASTDGVVTAQGQLDAVQYGDLLQPRGLVGLRGAGFSYDGLYYVKQVVHTIKRGDYKQQFSLTREGTGATVPAVLP